MRERGVCRGVRGKKASFREPRTTGGKGYSERPCGSRYSKETIPVEGSKISKRCNLAEVQPVCRATHRKLHSKGSRKDFGRLKLPRVIMRKPPVTETSSEPGLGVLRGGNDAIKRCIRAKWAKAKGTTGPNGRDRSTISQTGRETGTASLLAGESKGSGEGANQYR